MDKRKKFVSFDGCVDFKAADLADGHAIGAAAVMGNIDRGGDCIFPGAFKKAIPGFLKDGFISLGHDWNGLPIGMPVSAKEIGSELVCEFVYHDIPAAQDARKVALERQGASKSVGLSIGYSCDEWVQFDSGAQLLTFAKDNGYDLTLFDTKGIRAWKKSCWGLMSISDLYEFGQVSVPMNPAAVQSRVKTISSEESGSLNDLTFDDHSESVLTAVKEYADRCADYKAKREAKGRLLSEARRAEFTECKELLEKLLVLDDTVDSPTDAEAAYARLAHRTLSMATARMAS